MIVRIVVDCKIAVPKKSYGVADDLAVQSSRPVVAIDSDRRSNRQDRAGHLAVRIAVERDCLVIIGRHIEQQALVISAGGRIDPEIWIPVPGYITGGEEKGYIIAVDMAGSTEMDPGAAVHMNLHVVTGQRAAVEAKVSAGEQEFDVICSDLWSQNTQTAFKAVCAGAKNDFTETDKIDPAGMSAGRDDLTTLGISRF